MNKFTISIKQDGEYQPIQATPVFPFSWGELLDERLDEAYITLYDSREKTYKRLTDVKVTINEKEDEAKYFIIASDNSYELPVGSGKYKHDIYLIERTKLLEGIFCSSITFTNSQGIDFIINKTYAAAKVVPAEGFYPQEGGFDTHLINTPIKSGESYTVPSAYDFAQELLEVLDADLPTIRDATVLESGVNEVTTERVYTSVYVTGTDITTSRALWKETITVTPVDNLNIIYTVVISTEDGAGGKFLTFFRFLINPAVVNNILPLKKWTITDCITRACELAEPLFQGETPKYRLAGVEYDESGKATYQTGSLADKYNKVFAPEFTATEDTLREQLKLILSYVHAEPWLDKDNVIQVTEYGSTKNSAAASLPYVYNAVSSHINEYCTEVRSHAQNLVSSLGYARGVITDPGNGLYRSVRSDTAYVRINEGNAMAITNAPIYSIDKVMCGIARTDGEGWQLAPKEITPYVFEETEYSANLSSYAGAYPRSKQYAIYYTQGAPNLKGLFFKVPDALNAAKFSYFAISNILASVTNVPIETIDGYLTDASGAASLVFSITYKPISSHFVSHGKQIYIEGETPYMQLYNQSENLVESQYYGENLRGVAARLGNIEKERTFILKNINDVPKVGEILDGYAISAVSCELYPFDIKCTVGLTKDFNRISEYVGINSQKRMYEISERAAVDRAILIKETLVISGEQRGYDSEKRIFGDLTPFENIFFPVESYTSHKISTAGFQAKKPNGKTAASKVCLPVISRALGNVITFNFGMKDNYSAGAKTQHITGTVTNITGRWEDDVPYSNYYGRAWFADVELYGGNLADDKTPKELADFAYKVPAVTSILPPSENAYAKITNHILRKDNRERISYNVELEIKTDREDIIIGPALSELCGWVNDSDVTPVIYYFDATQYRVRKFDKRYTPHEGETAQQLNTVDRLRWENYDNGSAMLYVPPASNSGWVICTPIETETVTVSNENGTSETVTYTTGGEILLANNRPSSGVLNFYVVKN